MGKTKKNRIRYTIRSNPLGKSDGSNTLNGIFTAEELNRTGPLEAVREQLLNANVEEKVNGLQSLAVLTVSKENVAAVCRSDLVRIAAPLLCEPDPAVRNAAAGALRNLSVCGPDVCEFMVEQDVLTPLLTLLSEFTRDTEWTPKFDTSMGGQIDIRSDVFLQGVNLLWNLCESTSVALNFFNQTELLEGLIRCLDFKQYGLDIAMSVAQCLLVISEDNPKSWNVLNQHKEAFLCLLDIKDDYGHSYLCTLSAGILSNVPALAAAFSRNIILALSQILDANHQIILATTIGSLPNQLKESNVPDLEMDTDTVEEETEDAAAVRRRRQELPTDADIAIGNLGYLLDAQRVSAEIITNLCSTEDEEWTDAENDDDSDSESVLDYEIEGSNESSNGNLMNGDKLPVDILEIIKSTGLIDKLWKKAQPISKDFEQLLRETSKTLLMKIKNLRISTLLCLQNLCNILSSEDLGGPVAIYNVWVDLGQLVFQGSEDVALLEPSTSLMRSALEHLRTNRKLFNQMTETDLQLILDGINSCTVGEIRANWLRMLGTLGCLLPENLVKIIMSFIVETCAKEEDVWTMSEALDAFMDMFSDNDWNDIVVQLSLSKSFKELAKKFTAKVRQSKRDLKERYPAVKTVQTNLCRFVKYIEKQSVAYANGDTGRQ